MEELIIKKTNNTPGINFNPDTGVMKIEGRSIPEDPGDFFDPVAEWLESYFADDPKDITRFDINLEYVNSGSSKYLLGLFRKLKLKNDAGYKCVIDWYYEEDDESIYGLGEHYRTTVKLPFNLIEFI